MSVARIYDVVSDFRELRKSGVEWTCPCPIHKGTHLNHFKVSPAKNIYYCFVCGAGGDCVDFLMKYNGMSYPDAMRWLGQKYGIEVDERQKQFDVKPSKPVPIESAPELPTLSLPLDLVRARLDTSNDTLCCWLRSLPWEDDERQRVDKVIKAYGVGSSNNGMTIFWQIDETGRVRTGKMMRYKADGHRDREARYNSDWIHATLARSRRTDLFDPSKQQAKPCLFGLHLLNAKGVNTTTVNIVESEKTALICAIAIGSRNGLWMATGGLQFLRREQLQPLMDLGCTIVIHPDHDGERLWREKVSKFGYDNIIYSNQYVDAYWRESDGAKADAADIILRKMDERARASKTRQLDAWLHDHPKYNNLVSHLDMELVSNNHGE